MQATTRLMANAIGANTRQMCLLMAQSLTRFKCASIPIFPPHHTDALLVRTGTRPERQGVGLLGHKEVLATPPVQSMAWNVMTNACTPTSTKSRLQPACSLCFFRPQQLQLGIWMDLLDFHWMDLETSGWKRPQRMPSARSLRLRALLPAPALPLIWIALQTLGAKGVTSSWMQVSRQSCVRHRLALRSVACASAA